MKIDMLENGNILVEKDNEYYLIEKFIFCNKIHLSLTSS